MMETWDHIAGMRVVGGNVALDLANTMHDEFGGEPDFDHLGDYGDLVAWSVRVGLVSEGSAGRLLEIADRRPSEAEAAHARVLATRDLLYEVFGAVAVGERPSPEGLEALRREEGEAISEARLVPVGGRFAWEWPDGEYLGRMRYPVVHAAVELLTRGPLDRLKTCAACPWLFLDESKNRSRRWCSMEVCGTDEKVRRYLARRAARRTGNQPDP